MFVRGVVPVLLLALSSCFLNSFEYAPIHSEDGVAWIRWTIDGRADEWSCSSFVATNAKVVILDSDDDVVITREPSCDDFESRQELDAGTYTAAVSLLDNSSRVVAQPIRVPFAIERGKTTFVDIRFVTPGPT